MAGWAGEVIGEIAVRLLGRVSWEGKRMGDVKAGHFNLEIWAKLSAMSKVPGHGRSLG